MFFVPNTKSKRYAQLHQHTVPFPQCNHNISKFEAVFTGLTVEISNTEHINEIYNNGFYGKGSRSRSVPECVRNYLYQSDEDDGKLDETLILSLEEAFLLAHYLEVLEIHDLNGKVLSSEEIFTDFLKVNMNFVHSMVGYLYLKSKNWIVKSGIKFGGDFLIYRKGPRFYHASFIVVLSTDDSRQMKDVKGLQRVGETSDKDLLYLNIYPPKYLKADIPISEHLKYLDDYTVAEFIVKRLNFSSFVQSSQK